MMYKIIIVENIQEINSIVISSTFGVPLSGKGSSMTYCRKPEHDPAAIKENKTETNSQKLRRCLATGCGRMFPSAWAGERICPECRRGDLFQDGENPFEDPAILGHH